MPLTEVEKQEIEKEAYRVAKVFAESFRNGTAINDEIREARLAYQEAWTKCSTAWAKKLKESEDTNFHMSADLTRQEKNAEIEERDSEIEGLKDGSEILRTAVDGFKAQLESAQEENRILKESIPKEGTITVDEMVKTVKRKFELEAELSRLKEIAAKMAEALEMSEHIGWAEQIGETGIDLVCSARQALASYQTLLEGEKTYR